MLAKLDQLANRLVELDELLMHPDATSNMDSYRKMTREHAELGPLVALYRPTRKRATTSPTAQEMLGDPDMKEFAQEEIEAAKATMARLERELQTMLLPKDVNDERNIFLEIRAGTGGDESALFAGDLLRMYTRFAERNRWQVETGVRVRLRPGRLPRSDRARGRQRRVFEAEVRIGRPPRAARAGHRNAGPHPHLGLHGGRDAGSR